MSTEGFSGFITSGFVLSGVMVDVCSLSQKHGLDIIIYLKLLLFDHFGITDRTSEISVR